MRKNEQKQELEPEPCYDKKELRSRIRKYTHENQELRSWNRSHVYDKNNSGAKAGTVSFLRRPRSPQSNN